MVPDASIWDVDYINEEHLEAFENALNADEGEATAASSPVAHVHHYFERTKKISAVSDFAPIHTRVRGKTRRSDPPKKQGFSYHIVRWPLLGLIFTFIFVEFYIYVVIRQCVNTFEWFVGRGKKGRLRANLRGATTYTEWKEAAKALDEYMDYDTWRTEPEDPYYDYTLVQKVLRSLRNMRAQDDVQGVLGVLGVCIRGNFAGLESPRLYSETYYKSKDLVEAYATEVEQALVYIRESSKLSIEEKRKFFRSANTNLGASALCLSGGAGFGYYHLGVIRALLDARMLPRVITGTSAGGLIAAIVCTHTDDELKELIVPRLSERITASSDPMSVWLVRFWKTGARFDTVEWARKAAFFTRGSLTFREAYELTGRVLNISVIPFSTHSPSKILNHLTSPDCVIWSAIIASAAVPGILNPVVLMQKTKSGSIIPWNFGGKFKDGSLRVDIPLQSLNLLFNVNYPIVSQVNPHVHLFNFAPRGSVGRPVAHRKGKGWRGGFVLSAAEQFLKLELTKNFKVIRDLELMPHLLGQDWSSVFLQRFEGAVTIFPRSRLRDWFRLLTDPDSAELERMIGVGERVTWPKLHMIGNRYRIEREIYRGRMAVRQALNARERDKNRATIPEPSRLTPAATEGDTPGAGPSSSQGKLPAVHPSQFEQPLDQQQSSNVDVPIESDAEAAIQARDSRFLQAKRKKGPAYGRDSPISRSPSRESGPLQVQSDNPTTDVSQRRKWISQAVDGDEDEEDSRERGSLPDHLARPSPRNGNDSHLKPSRSPENKRIALQPTASFISRLRTGSFPALSLPSFGRARSVTSSSANEEPEGTRTPRETWSSDSDDEDDVQWTGALMTPRAGSRFLTPSVRSAVMGDALGLGLDGVENRNGVAHYADAEDADEEAGGSSGAENDGA
ncbi:hypothetical protein FRB95_006509 [Tulasnella sp. JGI-2019a]|nr:hypothetical protein FRB95_006509 [Tulasnella sp. JGI-2019a]